MNIENAKRAISDAQILLNYALDQLEESSTEFPIPESQLVWANGNLWKPSSESDGRLVVLLRADWPLPDMVKALREDDVWETLEYTGSDHNGNRHHYRGDFPGADYRGRRKGGGVRVFYNGDYGYIPLPGPAKNRHG